MNPAKRSTLKAGVLAIALLLAVLAVSFPAPARAYCLWGVMITDYYSTGGVCVTGCDNRTNCSGDTSGYVYDSQMGECWYCY